MFLEKERPCGMQGFKPPLRPGGQFKDQVSSEACVYVVGLGLGLGHLRRATPYSKAWAAGYGVEIKMPQMVPLVPPRAGSSLLGPSPGFPVSVAGLWGFSEVPENPSNSRLS